MILVFPYLFQNFIELRMLFVRDKQPLPTFVIKSILIAYKEV